MKPLRGQRLPDGERRLVLRRERCWGLLFTFGQSRDSDVVQHVSKQRSHKWQSFRDGAFSRLQGRGFAVGCPQA